MRVEARGARVFRAQRQQLELRLDSDSGCRISIGVFPRVVRGSGDDGGQPRAEWLKIRQSFALFVLDEISAR